MSSRSPPPHPDSRAAQRVLRAAAGALVVVAATYLAAFKRGWVEPRAAVFASLVAAAALALAGVVMVASWRLVRGPGRLAALAEALAAGGLVAVAAGGFANWAFSVQGFVVVPEREPVRLSRAGDVEAFTAGPLADRRELDVTLALARLEFRPVGPVGFDVVSRLNVLSDDGEEVRLSVSRQQPAPYRTLVFRQGAFGFAPRVVVVRDGRTVLDTFVPFRTVREGPHGVTFLGEFEIAAERLHVSGAVTLENLNDDMKGHPTLELAVERDGAAVGAGKLRPGEYAALSDGSRVAFAGLQRWSEIDFSRRTYPIPMGAGAVLLAVGLLVWFVAAWRRW